MIQLTLRLNDALTVILWPKWNRAALVTPFHTHSLSIGELQSAVRKARKGGTRGR